MLYKRITCTLFLKIKQHQEPKTQGINLDFMQNATEILKQQKHELIIKTRKILTL